MKLNAGEKAPEEVNVFIEIPAGSSVKYEYDKEGEVLRVDRFLYTSMVYPMNYGYVPGTLEADGDPIDVLVITNQPLVSNCVITARPIGVLHMEDEKGVDEKIIAVPKDKLDPSFAGIKDITDLPEPIKNKLKHFFDHMKELEPNKWVKTTGFGSAADAKARIKGTIKQ